MAVEVDNLAPPYTSLVFIRVYLSKADWEAGRSVQGSGLLIGPNDVLTASHVVNDETGDYLRPYIIEVIPAFDAVPLEQPFGVFTATQIAHFRNVDLDGNGFIAPGDGISSTFFDAELDVAVITLGESLSVPTDFSINGDFNQGTVHISGYPARAGGNPMDNSVFMSKNGVDNSFAMDWLSDLGAGSSGGPAWQYVNGNPNVYGVISTAGTIASLGAHAQWIEQYVSLNNGQMVGSSADDILRPLIADFAPLNFPGLEISVPLQRVELSPYRRSPFWGSMDGGAGTDTIVVPWASTAEPPEVPWWSINWVKNASGNVFGYFYEGDFAAHFQNVERVAFTDVIFDFAQYDADVLYAIGPITVDGSIEPTGGDTSMVNPAALDIQSIAGDSDDNYLLGSQGKDYIYGLGGADTLSGSGGDDLLLGDSGNDTLIGGLGGDGLDGGAGSDTASYRDAATGVIADLGNPVNNTGEAAGDSYVSIENLEGSGFADELVGDAGVNRLFGGAGDDSIYGRAGDDALFGGPGDDLLYGGPGNDLLAGGGGSDALRGGPGSDRLVGGPGGDRLLGGGDIDFLRGSGSDDILRGHAGDDRLFGAAGNDNLHGGGGNDLMRGGVGDDVLRGGPGDNLLIGNGGHDRLIGGNHDDVLYGGAGNDVLVGNFGNDRLVGGAGNDMLVGGGGADLFVVQLNGGNDVVIDFENDLDLLDFRAFGFASKSSVLNLATQIGADVVFALPGGETVELTGFNINLLGAGDVLV